MAEFDIERFSKLSRMDISPVVYEARAKYQKMAPDEREVIWDALVTFLELDKATEIPTEHTPGEISG
jgi:hypothetical protein